MAMQVRVTALRIKWRWRGVGEITAVMLFSEEFHNKLHIIYCVGIYSLIIDVKNKKIKKN